MSVPRLVVDASVAFKWYYPEEDAEIAGALLERSERGELELIAPEFLALELLNIIWKQLRRQAITARQADRAMEAIPEATITWVWDAPHLEAAYRLATAHDCSVYDALYLAVGEANDAMVITADRGLREKAPERVRMLGEFGSLT